MSFPRLARWSSVLLLSTALTTLPVLSARADDATLWETVKVRTQQVFALGGETARSLYGWLARFGGEDSRLATDLLAFTNKDLRDLELLVDSAGYRLEDITIHRRGETPDVTLGFAYQRAVDARHKAELRDIIARDNALVDEDTRSIVGSLLEATARAQAMPRERFETHRILIHLGSTPQVAFNFQARGTGTEHGALAQRTRTIGGLMPTMVSSAVAATPDQAPPLHLTSTAVVVPGEPARTRLASSDVEGDPEPPKPLPAPVAVPAPAAVAPAATASPAAPAPVPAEPAAKPAAPAPVAAEPAAKPAEPPAAAPAKAPDPAVETPAATEPKALQPAADAKPPADIVGVPEAAKPDSGKSEPAKAEGPKPTTTAPAATEPAKPAAAPEPAAPEPPKAPELPKTPEPPAPPPVAVPPAEPRPVQPEPGKSSALPAPFLIADAGPAAEAAPEPAKTEAPKSSEPAPIAKPEAVTEPAKAEAPKPVEPALAAKPEPAAEPAKAEAPKPAEPAPAVKPEPVAEPAKAEAPKPAEPAPTVKPEPVADAAKAEAPKPAEPAPAVKPEPVADTAKAEAPKPVEPAPAAKPEPAAEPAKAETPKPVATVAEPVRYRVTLTHTNGRAGPSKDAKKLRAVSPKDVLIKTGKSQGRWWEFTIQGATGPTATVWIYETVFVESK